jgi:hypothetical protein
MIGIFQRYRLYSQGITQNCSPLNSKALEQISAKQYAAKLQAEVLTLAISPKLSYAYN